MIASVSSCLDDISIDKKRAQRRFTPTGHDPGPKTRRRAVLDRIKQDLPVLCSIASPDYTLEAVSIWSDNRIWESETLSSRQGTRLSRHARPPGAPGRPRLCRAAEALGLSRHARPQGHLGERDSVELPRHSAGGTLALRGTWESETLSSCRGTRLAGRSPSRGTWESETLSSCRGTWLAGTLALPGHSGERDSVELPGHSARGTLALPGRMQSP